MIEFDFEGYAKSQIDKALGYLEGFSKGYHQAKSEWVGLTKEDADSIECWFREEIENDRFSVENLIAYIETKLKERNT